MIKLPNLGDLLLKYPENGSWCPGRVSVRCGQLVVWAKEGSNGIRAATVRIPLRHLTWSIAHISGELLPLLPCISIYLMQYREERFDSLVTQPQRAVSSRLLTGVRFVTSHSSTDIQTESALMN
nr:unnamed protein product [Callosobruchus chinensis]